MIRITTKSKPKEKETKNNTKKKKILITAALPYVNNIPHLGNIIGCVLSADVFSRYCKSQEYNSLYICGTDEYGTATEIKALEENCTPKQICDKYNKIHKDIYEWFNINFDYFGRTSTKLHEEITHQIFNKLYKNGFIVEEEVEQPYDEKAKMFLADRYIEGVCPFCQSEQARADQCDKCGKLLTYAELIEPKSKITKTKPILKRTKHLFIDLPSLEKELEKWIEKTSKEGFWSANSYAVAKAWLKEGLKKRAITRDLKWGIPVPLKGYENKKFYVWFEAPIGYISITANHTENWKDWWLNPNNINLYQFMGKDNIPFHTVIFPSTLLGTKEPWTMLHHINTTEFLNYEGGKFSKSKGTGVFGDGAVNSGVPSDVWRYYLLINRPEQADTNFSWSDFGEKLNNELVANLGNLVNRTLIFIQNNLKGKIPKGKLSKEDEQFLENQKARYSQITFLLEKVQIKDALHEIMVVSKHANKYFQDNKPWELVKSNPPRADAVLFVLANQIKDLAILVEPYLPSTSAAIFNQLNTKQKKWKDLGMLDLENHEIGKVEILFKKIEPVELEKLREKYSGKQFADSEPSFKVSEPASALGIKAAAALLEVKTISNKNSELENLKKQKFKLEDSGYVELHKKVGAEELSSIRWLHELNSKTGQIPNI
ncbi:methionine--tRNA ligase, partial [Candidatus Micrarchaeota archaeon]|nr:methionine--tRNA ligase [Candidatus Micrarchaeota archaeon]